MAHSNFMDDSAVISKIGQDSSPVGIGDIDSNGNLMDSIKARNIREMEDLSNNLNDIDNKISQLVKITPTKTKQDPTISPSVLLDNMKATLKKVSVKVNEIEKRTGSHSFTVAGNGHTYGITGGFGERTEILDPTDVKQIKEFLKLQEQIIKSTDSLSDDTERWKTKNLEMDVSYPEAQRELKALETRRTQTRDLMQKKIDGVKKEDRLSVSHYNEALEEEQHRHEKAVKSLLAVQPAANENISSRYNHENDIISKSYISNKNVGDRRKFKSQYNIEESVKNEIEDIQGQIRETKDPNKIKGYEVQIEKLQQTLTDKQALASLEQRRLKNIIELNTAESDLDPRLAARHIAMMGKPEEHHNFGSTRTARYDKVAEAPKKDLYAPLANTVADLKTGIEAHLAVPVSENAANHRTGVDYSIKGSEGKQMENFVGGARFSASQTGNLGFNSYPEDKNNAAGQETLSTSYGNSVHRLLEIVQSKGWTEEDLQKEQNLQLLASDPLTANFVIKRNGKNYLLPEIKDYADSEIRYREQNEEKTLGTEQSFGTVIPREGINKGSFLLSGTIDKIVRNNKTGKVSLVDYKNEKELHPFMHFAQGVAEAVLLNSHRADAKDSEGNFIFDKDTPDIDSISIVKRDPRTGKVTRSYIPLGNEEQQLDLVRLAEEAKRTGMSEEQFFKKAGPLVQEQYANEYGSLQERSIMTDPNGGGPKWTQIKMGDVDSSFLFDDEAHPKSSNTAFAQWQTGGANRRNILEAVKKAINDPMVPTSTKKKLFFQLKKIQGQAYDPTIVDQSDVESSREYVTDLLSVMDTRQIFPEVTTKSGKEDYVSDYDSVEMNDFLNSPAYKEYLDSLGHSENAPMTEEEAIEAVKNGTMTQEEADSAGDARQALYEEREKAYKTYLENPGSSSAKKAYLEAAKNYAPYLGSSHVNSEGDRGDSFVRDPEGFMHQAYNDPALQDYYDTFKTESLIDNMNTVGDDSDPEEMTQEAMKNAISGKDLDLDNGNQGNLRDAKAAMRLMFRKTKSYTARSGKDYIDEVKRQHDERVKGIGSTPEEEQKKRSLLLGVLGDITEDDLYNLRDTYLGDENSEAGGRLIQQIFHTIDYNSATDKNNKPILTSGNKQQLKSAIYTAIFGKNYDEDLDFTISRSLARFANMGEIYSQIPGGKLTAEQQKENDFGKMILSLFPEGENGEAVSDLGMLQKIYEKFSPEFSKDDNGAAFGEKYGQAAKSFIQRLGLYYSKGSQGDFVRMPDELRSAFSVTDGIPNGIQRAAYVNQDDAKINALSYIRAGVPYSALYYSGSENGTGSWQLGDEDYRTAFDSVKVESPKTKFPVKVTKKTAEVPVSEVIPIESSVEGKNGNGDGGKGKQRIRISKGNNITTENLSITNSSGNIFAEKGIKFGAIESPIIHNENSGDIIQNIYTSGNVNLGGGGSGGGSIGTIKNISKKEFPAAQRYQLLKNQENQTQQKIFDQRLALKRLGDGAKDTPEYKARQAVIDRYQKDLKTNQEDQRDILLDFPHHDWKTSIDQQNSDYWVEAGTKNALDWTKASSSDRNGSARLSSDDRQLLSEGRGLLNQRVLLKNKIVALQKDLNSSLRYMNPTTKAQGKLQLAEYGSEFQDIGTQLSSVGQSISGSGNQELIKLFNSSKDVALQKDRLNMIQGRTRNGGASSIFASLKMQLSSLVANFTQFGAAYMIIGKVKSAISEVVSEAGKLNKAMTNIQIVTGDNETSARSLMKSYAGLASQLSATTEEVATAANDWLRQGMTISDTNSLITDSIHLSTLGMITQSEATQDLTSIMKGYKLSVSEVSGAVDKLTAVDMKSASSAGGIAQALQQVANVANSAGVSLDQSIGMISTISDVTQREPSSVGQSLRTMIARFGNVKAGAYSSMNIDSDNEDATSNINDIEKVLKKLGISVRSSNLEFRDFDDVLGDIAGKWDTIDSVSKNAIATAMAGVRNREQFVALMSNWDKYQKLTEVSANSAGTAEKKYLSYTEQLEAAQKRLQAAWESIAQNSDFDKFLITITNLGARLVKDLPIIAKWVARIITTTSSYKLPSLFRSGLLGGATKSGFRQGILGRLGNKITGYSDTVAETTLQRREGAYTNGLEGLSILPDSASKLIGSNTNLGAKIDNVAALLEKRTGQGSGKKVEGQNEKVQEQIASGTTTKDLTVDENVPLVTTEGVNFGKSSSPAAWFRNQKQIRKNLRAFRKSERGQRKAERRAAFKQYESGVKDYQHSGEFASTAISNTIMGALTAPTSGNWTNSITKDTETRDFSAQATAYSRLATGGASLIGTVAGSFLGPVGASIGGVIGQGLGEGLSKLFMSKVDEQANLLKDISSNGEKTLSAMSSISDDVTTMKDLSSKKSWNSEDYQKAKKTKESMVTTLNAEENEEAKQSFLDQVGLIDDKYKGKTVSQIMTDYLDGTASDREKIASAFQIAQGKTTATAYKQSQAETESNLQTALNQQDVSIGDYAYDADLTNLLDKVRGSNSAYNGVGFKDILNGKGFLKDSTYYDTSSLSSTERRQFYVDAMTEAEKEGNTTLVTKLNTIIEDFDVSLSKQEDINDSINNNTASSAVLGSTFSEYNGASLISLNKSQLKELGIDTIRAKVAEQLAANGGLEGHDIWNDTAHTSLTDYAKNLIDTQLKSYSTIYGVITGQSYTLSEALGLPTGTEAQQETRQETLESFADALGVTVNELDTLKDKYGDTTLGDILATPEELRTELSSYADILGQIASSTGITKETIEKIISDYPELIQYLGDSEQLVSALIKKTSQTSGLYTSQITSSMLSSSSVFDKVKEYLKTNNPTLYTWLTNNAGNATSLNDILALLGTGSTEANGILDAVSQIYNYTIEIPEEQTALNNAISYQTKMYDKQIDNLTEQKDALSKINDQREYGNKLIEAQLKLENAQKEKKRVYRSGVGFVYESDQESIKSAQEELDDLDVEKQTDLLQTEIDELTAQKTLLSDLADNEELENLKASYDAWAESNGVINSDQAKILQTITDLYGAYASINLGSATEKAAKEQATKVSEAETAMNTAYDVYTKNMSNENLVAYQKAVKTYLGYNPNYTLTGGMKTAYEKTATVQQGVYYFKDGDKYLKATEQSDTMSSTGSDATYILKDAKNGKGYMYYYDSSSGSVIKQQIDPSVASEYTDLASLSSVLYSSHGPNSNSQYSGPVLLVGEDGAKEWASNNGNGLRAVKVEDDTSTTHNSDFYSAALGSLSLPGAATLVNELGTEAIVTPYGTMTSLPSNTGIVPADLTKKLYDLGDVSPSILNALGEYKSDLSSGVTPNSTTTSTDDSLNINGGFTMNVNADGSFDPDAFVEQLKQAASLTKRNH